MPSTGCCPGPWSRCSLSKLHPSDPAGISLSTHKSSCSRRRLQPGERGIHGRCAARAPEGPAHQEMDGGRIPADFSPLGNQKGCLCSPGRKDSRNSPQGIPENAPRPGWSNLGWWKVSCPWHRGDWLGFKVPSNPTHPGMWFPVLTFTPRTEFLTFNSKDNRKTSVCPGKSSFSMPPSYLETPRRVALKRNTRHVGLRHEGKGKVGAQGIPGQEQGDAGSHSQPGITPSSGSVAPTWERSGSCWKEALDVLPPWHCWVLGVSPPSLLNCHRPGRENTNSILLGNGASASSSFWPPKSSRALQEQDIHGQHHGTDVVFTGGHCPNLLSPGKLSVQPDTCNLQGAAHPKDALGRCGWCLGKRHHRHVCTSPTYPLKCLGFPLDPLCLWMIISQNISALGKPQQNVLQELSREQLETTAVSGRAELPDPPGWTDGALRVNGLTCPTATESQDH
ncbi:uncharacterized protein LOC113997416 isoform X2 [Pipra filicauda]|uniref:Uncharacterized protein LOC113997416 isoform X2 n=1 Tax=Pipra filicauda TaxID=649802 RepID=A0A7R5L5N2_9PASS|nr:uncharacterized protein LOC113997416 isoform X2 [Pipra filicauda]